MVSGAATSPSGGSGGSGDLRPRRGGILPLDVPASQRPRRIQAWRAVLDALATDPRRVLLCVGHRERRPTEREYGLWLANGQIVPLVHLAYDDERGFYDERLATE